jgi:3-(3-hydroxy-phenyl)propionate hydroxylase
MHKSLYFDYPHYPFTSPPELEGHSEQYSVVITGAGPVGITAALELARHDVKSIVVDAKASVTEGSRALCIARHSMECLQQLELDETFANKALPWTHGTSYYRDKEVYRLEMPHSDAERFYPMYNLQQQYIEKFLIDKAEANPLIEIRWQSPVTDIAQHDEFVSIQIETSAGDYELKSDFVLAADGARSVTRKNLGLKLQGDAYEGRYVIADIQMKSDYPTERRAFFDPLSNPGLTILIHKQPDNIWRIDYQIDENMDADEETKEESIRARISSILEMINENSEWKLEWWSLYKAYTLALDDYRHKNILFLGDAAHLVPIFGVRGLNSGIADAMNAAWKLAYVIKGCASDELLDSYSPERRGATLDVFENASKSTKFMTPPSRGHKLMRDAALSIAIKHEFTRPLINPRQSQPYTYLDSALSSCRNRDTEFSGGPGTGAPIFNQHIGESSYLLDYIGKGFSGLYFSEKGDVSDEIVALSDTLGVGEEKFALVVITSTSSQLKAGITIEDRDGKIFSSYNAVNNSFYFVRPDRHVLARWKHINVEEVKQAFTHCLNGGRSE